MFAPKNTRIFLILIACAGLGSGIAADTLAQRPGSPWPAWVADSATPPAPSIWKGLYGLDEPGPGHTWTALLSGTGKDATIPWEFMVSAGRKQGTWTTIPVPSCWDMEGFGALSYGWDKNSETGNYRHTFVVPPSWKGRTINLVCDGIMTDCEIRINGKPAGERHQGSFYRFRRSMDGLLEFGKENTLEITVWKQSSDPSVNKAERQADYWVFGGIFRPLWLEALPANHIAGLSVDARAEGNLAVQADIEAAQGTNLADLEVEASVSDRSGRVIATLPAVRIDTETRRAVIEARVPSVQPWTAETPHLYTLTVKLRGKNGVLHHSSLRTGFRTIEVKEEDGIYLNGSKVFFKGVNRHAFHPDTGRTLNSTLDRSDIELMKAMNMNAVRMSHYPPDQSFLELCDEMGMYVIDELAGWQGAYGTSAGRILVREMIQRDRNHPSIFFWANGNEGGWNTDLDAEFDQLDLQQRPILHPWAKFRGIDTDHYEPYESTGNKVDWDIFMPTEFLHGLYDGGSGAGLDDYWKFMGNPENPTASGGFLWAFLDEGVNTHTNRLDTAGNAAPDGIVGPYREREASFYTIRDIFSPLQFTDSRELAQNFSGFFDGKIRVQNRYGFTNLDTLSINWELRSLSPLAGDKSAVLEPLATSKGKNPSLDWMANTGGIIIAQGTCKSPSIAPMKEGTIPLELPQGWKKAETLRILARDQTGRIVASQTWPLQSRGELAGRVLASLGCPGATPDAVLSKATPGTDGSWRMEAGETTMIFDAATGLPQSIRRGTTVIPLSKGPLVIDGESRLEGARSGAKGRTQILEFSYSGSMERVRWTLMDNGRVDLEYTYRASGKRERMGVNFSLPEKSVQAMALMADGPQRVYRNRMRGPEFGLWYKKAGSDRQGWDYPEFKGYYARPLWVRFEGDTWNLGIINHDDGMFLRVFNIYSPADAKNAFVMPVKGGDISLMDGIPAIGDKFLTPSAMGPQGQPWDGEARYTHKVSMVFSVR